VIGVDVNPEKVQALNSGRSPIIEPQVEEFLTEGYRARRLSATTDTVAAVCESDVSFVCVGTPGCRNGKLDLSHVMNVCRDIGQGIARKNSYHWVVVRSTVLPGTTRTIAIPALEASSGKRFGVDFAACYNPEFMREGSAVADFFQPPYTIFGTEDPCHVDPLRGLYSGIPGRIVETQLDVAEMIKYVSNTFHALKVSFANEIGTFCKQLRVDSRRVMEIFALDTRLNISPAYLSPGFAFGGSCLPKDLRALNYRARELDLQLPLLSAILPSNLEHTRRAAEIILCSKKKGVGVLGLSFKAGTDDLRESPQVELIKQLLGEGCQVRIWDPFVSLGQLTGSNRQFIEQVIPHIGSLLAPGLREVIDQAEVIVIGTRLVERQALAAHLRPHQIVIDLVNLKDSDSLDGAAPYEGICW
jgi:GDP-mannose 6-dehydrogenase